MPSPLPTSNLKFIYIHLQGFSVAKIRFWSCVPIAIRKPIARFATSVRVGRDSRETLSRHPIPFPWRELGDHPRGGRSVDPVVTGAEVERRGVRE